MFWTIYVDVENLLGWEREKNWFQIAVVMENIKFQAAFFVYPAESFGEFY